MLVKMKSELDITQKRGTDKENQYIVNEEGIVLYDIEKSIILVSKDKKIGEGKVKSINIIEKQTEITFEITKLFGVS